MPQKKTKTDRRTQLLETARRIVLENGTDALTLGTLAEKAGVSRPIAYNHFATRPGLMIALYKGIMDRQTQALADALKETPPTLGDVSEVLAMAYMNCHEDIGLEWHAIGAALKGDADMDAARSEMLEGHAAFFSAALTPLSPLSAEVVTRRCIGIIGAGEALSDAMVRGQVTKQAAVDDFTALIVGWLGAAI
ncbi:TetR/AcrR family transcriptional regulator [Falsirhodobacter sp. 1013]|uniref:TetR/AcrR family transcriptional regulator n=1 Tax=Falsirhodobacter sp. 1013 TaxID=3417566 RepID=UPI003EBD934A